MIYDLPKKDSLFFVVSVKKNDDKYKLICNIFIQHINNTVALVLKKESHV